MSKTEEAGTLGARMALDLVADKWTIPLLHTLKRGTKRRLILTLRNMERDDLVTRTVYPAVLPMTEYALNPLGESLWGPLHTLCLWADRHFEAVPACRRRSEAARERAPS